MIATKDMHLFVNTKYQAALRGPGYNNQDDRCKAMGYVTKLARRR